jgi:hypothetical protein
VIRASGANSTPASVLVTEFSLIYVTFPEKRFTVLFHRSSDRFQAGNFHPGCEHHPGTLTIILDSNGNVWGGYTRLQCSGTPLIAEVQPISVVVMHLRANCPGQARA